MTSISVTFKDLEVFRDGDGDRLVLLHGIQGTATSWRPVLPYLKQWTCVMPNLPGRGNSPRWIGPPNEAALLYSLDVYADLLHACLEQEHQASGKRVALVGWSMGVSVILRMWARHGGEHISRQALLSGTPSAGEGAGWFLGADIDAVSVEAKDRARRLGLKEVADPEAVAWSWLSVKSANQRDVARVINVPTLILHGEKDDQSPLAHAHWLAKSIPDAKLCLLEGAGHSLMTERTDLVGRTLQKFLRENTNIPTVSD